MLLLVAALFCLACGITSTALLPVGLGVLCMLAARYGEKHTSPESSAARSAFASRCGENGKRFLPVLVGLVLCDVFLIAPMCSSGGIRAAISFNGVFSLPGIGVDLHANTEKELSPDAVVFLPGARWKDTEGTLIQAHGGQVQKMPVPDGNGDTQEMSVPDGNGGMQEMYVWVGEDKWSGHLGNSVAVYTSEDLYHWEFRGDVLRSVPNRDALDTDPYFTQLYAGCSKEELDHIYAIIGADKVIERPKMLYNAKTGKYVIWFHNDCYTDKNSYYYDVGMAGVAVSDSPFGPFRLIDRYRLNECPPGQIDCYPTSKGEARDMNLFLDDDGVGYIVYTSENNKTLYISRLNDEFTNISGTRYGVDYIRLFPGAMREAPVLMKHEGRYYLMSSSTTGWMSNEARVWSSDTLFGVWRNDGNPCVGAGAAVTFDTQSTILFEAPNGQWFFGGDRWNGNELHDSRYVWLPVTFEGERLTIRWEEEWSWNED